MADLEIGKSKKAMSDFAKQKARPRKIETIYGQVLRIQEQVKKLHAKEIIRHGRK